MCSGFGAQLLCNEGMYEKSRRVIQIGRQPLSIRVGGTGARLREVLGCAYLTYRLQKGQSYLTPNSLRLSLAS